MDNSLKHIEVSLLPMLISNWIFGIGVIQFPLRKPRRIISFTYTAIFISTYLYLNYIAYPRFLKNWLVKTRPLPEQTFYFSQIILTISIIISGWFQMQEVDKCFLNAMIAKYLMQNIGISNNNMVILKKEFLRHIGFFFFIIFMAVLSYVIYSKSSTEKDIVVICVQIYPIIIVFLTDSAFNNVLSYAHTKFNDLNKILNSLLTSTFDRPLHLRISTQALNMKIKQLYISENNFKDYTFTIRNVRLAHLQLVKLCRKANSVFGFHILLSIVISFITIITGIFNIYLLVYSDLSVDEIFRGIIKNINMMLYFSIKSVMNSWTCANVRDASVTSGDLICELYDEPLINENTKQEIRYFNVQLIQNKLEFSAFGFVDIDPTLIQVMISTIGTYVVIMIQFQQVKSEPSSK